MSSEFFEFLWSLWLVFSFFFIPAVLVEAVLGWFLSEDDE